MKILALDTSSKTFSVAVMADGKVLAKKDVVLEKILSDSIIPTIDKVLAKAKVPLSKLDGFAVGLGPGSFTSLRVGVSTVKALSFATGKPVVGISSLDVIAQGVLSRSLAENIVVVSDAKRNLVYAASYRVKNGVLVRTGKYLLEPIEQVFAGIKGRTFLTGDGIGLFKEEIRRKKGIVLAGEKFWHPQAVHLSELAERKFLKKEYNDVDSLVPLYLYPEHCQVLPAGRQVQPKK